MNIGIAQEEDIEALSALLTLLFKQEAEFAPDVTKQRKGLSMIIRNPEVGEILTLKNGGQIIGMVSLLYTISTALGARVAWLEDMIIHPQHRSSGAGTQLIQAAIDHARENGCQRITLLTDSDNISAQRFYSRNGFQRSTMTPMRQVLE
jgi:GNAT superfamily N-acetyltransferase